jgi:tetratricopeptide (TPR) repeat protein
MTVHHNGRTPPAVGAAAAASTTRRGSYNPGAQRWSAGSSSGLFGNNTLPQLDTTNLGIAANTTSESMPYSMTSPVFQGLLRFSPRGAAANAAANNPVAATRTTTHYAGWNRSPRRSSFGLPAAAVAATAAAAPALEANQQPATLRNESAINRPSPSSTAGEYLDGIPIGELRLLVKNALDMEDPGTAVYYAAIVYAKTLAPPDALALARTHLRLGQQVSCLRVVEESNLLLLPPSHADYALVWEALILSCAALAAREEYTALLDLIEETCRLPADVNNTSSAKQLSLDDQDDEGWERLANLVSSSSTVGVIHPLARVCWWRGRGYHATGHGFRAALYWRRALHIDGRCVQAWEDLLKRQLITPNSAYLTLKPCISDNTSPPKDQDEDDKMEIHPAVRFTHKFDFSPAAAVPPARHPMDWLYTLYLSQIDLVPQNQGSTNMDAASKTQAAATSTLSPLGLMSSSRLFANTSNFLSELDASSILASPSLQTPLAPPHNQSNHRTLGTATSDTTPVQDDIEEAFSRLWTRYKLRRCPHVLAAAVRRAYRRCEWKKAVSYSRELSQLDPSLGDAAFCYISTLVVLGHKRALFGVAHEWVEAAPRAARSWFAVGAYYYCCERFHVAQRHFCRATRLDPNCTEAWIAFGCAFAACDESDQALASFRAAQRLSPGEHHSLLYMGMEYVRTNHLVLAEYFLQAAATASGGDPLCLHELGVLSLQKNDPVAGQSFFERALQAVIGTEKVAAAVELCTDPYWESTLFNLGHCYRKTRKFDLACLCFSQCSTLRPDKFSTYSALGFTKHLMNDLDGAIECYHRALSVKADDPFSTEMMNRALQEALETTLSVSSEGDADKEGVDLQSQLEASSDIDMSIMA